MAGPDLHVPSLESNDDMEYHNLMATAAANRAKRDLGRYANIPDPTLLIGDDENTFARLIRGVNIGRPKVVGGETMFTLPDEEYYRPPDETGAAEDGEDGKEEEK